jgi:hypothetical protein
VRPSTRPASVLAALALLAAGSVADAKVAYPPHCESPALLVGSVSGAALPSCTAGTGAACRGMRFVVRDASQVPLSGVTVFLDFSRTAIRLLGDDRPGTVVDCAARTIQRVTDATGTVEFSPRFVGSGEGVVVLADGATFALLRAVSTDVDGDGTTGVEDFMRVAADYASGAPNPPTDFDPCTPGSGGRTTLTDFTIFVQEYLQRAGSTLCP